MKLLFRRLMDAAGDAGTAGGGGNVGATTNREGASAAGVGDGTAAGTAAVTDAAAGSVGAAGDGGAGAAGGATAVAGGSAGATGAAAGAAANTGDAGAKWGANWREGWAANDEKKLSWAQRYASPQAMLDAAWSAQERIAKGELAKPLPTNPTAEQLTEYRKANGIPEKADGYWDGLPKELRLEEGDKEILAPYLPVMHELNLSPAQASKLIAFRQQEMQRHIDERQVADGELKTKTEDTLRQEWGGEYRAHVNNITGFLRTNFGEEGMDDIMNARTPNGDPLLGSPGVLRSLAQLAVATRGGNITITTADGGLVDAKGVDARLGEIVKLMGDDASEYWKGPKADGLQAEYRRLITAQQQMKSRAA